MKEIPDLQFKERKKSAVPRVEIVNKKNVRVIFVWFVVKTKIWVGDKIITRKY